jgi:large repetitive protein
MRHLLLLLLVATPALAGPRVLLLWDAKNSQTAALAKSLKDSGLEVTLSETDSAHFDGKNPALTNFEVAIHMNGTTWGSEMPLEGQKALVRFVQAGGGYIHHEWNAYQLSVGMLKPMREIILFDRVSGQGPRAITVRKVEKASHPVIWEVPTVFTMNGGANIGHIHQFAVSPSMVLARDDGGNDAIAVRELELGRVVGFHHGGNWGVGEVNSLDSNEARRLFVDSVRWAYGCDPSFREGRREKICAQIATLRAKH